MHKIITACLFSIMFFASGAVSGQSAEPPVYTLEQVHGPEQECRFCHIAHSKNDKPILRGSISEICSPCHKDRTASSEHVVDIKPSMDAGGLLLTDGMMTCVTCHESHNKGHRSMLRVDPRDLCLYCHRY